MLLLLLLPFTKLPKGGRSTCLRRSQQDTSHSVPVITMDSAGLSNALYRCTAQIVYLRLKLEPNARHTECHCCCPRAETFFPCLHFFSLFSFFYFPLVLFGSFAIIFMSSFSAVCVSFRLFGFYYFSVKFMIRLPPVFFRV